MRWLCLISENNNHQVMKVEKVNPQEGTLFKRFSRHFFAGLQLLQNATTAKKVLLQHYLLLDFPIRHRTTVKPLKTKVRRHAVVLTKELEEGLFFKIVQKTKKPMLGDNSRSRVIFSLFCNVVLSNLRIWTGMLWSLSCHGSSTYMTLTFATKVTIAYRLPPTCIIYRDDILQLDSI